MLFYISICLGEYTQLTEVTVKNFVRFRLCIDNKGMMTMIKTELNVVVVYDGRLMVVVGRTQWQTLPYGFSFVDWVVGKKRFLSKTNN